MDKQELMDGRSAHSLIGLPIYSLDNGSKKGAVKDVVYDTEHGKLIAFTVERPGLFSSHRFVLPFQNVKSIGRDAIMIAHGNMLLSAKDAPDIAHRTRDRRSISEKIVLTQSGNKLGSIADVILNDESGDAVSYEVSGGIASDLGSGRNYVAAPHAVVIGYDAVLVPDGTETTLEEQEPGGLAGAYKSAKARGEEYYGQAAQYTQEQEMRMSHGKRAGGDVRDNNDDLIVSEGDIVDDAVIDRAVRAGRMHQVALATGVGAAKAGVESAKERGRGAQPALQDTRERMSDWWSNLVGRTRESADRASRQRAVAAQKRFLEGRIAAEDVPDNNGVTVIRQGEVITPLILDTLDRQSRLEFVKVTPTVEPDVGAVHVVMEKPGEHEKHRTKAHI